MLNIDVYTDGSYVKDNPNTVSGGILVLVDGEPCYASTVRLTDKELASTRNAGGEVVAALRAFSLLSALMDGVDPSQAAIRVFYDYVGVYNFYSGKWRANNPFMKQYQIESRKLLERLNVKFFWVKSHSGNQYNNAVDWLARGRLPSWLNVAHTVEEL